MLRIRKITSLLLAVALAGGAPLLLPQAAQAQASAQGATDIDITLPDIVILHYFSNVDVSIDESSLMTFLNGGVDAEDEGTIAPTGNGLTQDLSLSPSNLSGDITAAVLTLQNAWAVRSISTTGSADTKVDIANTTSTLSHASVAGAQISITGVAVDDGTSNGASIQFAAPGLASPVIGDVELTMDLSDATSAGEYQDGVFTITATNL